mgnify:CR=1 FL=1
MEQAQNGFFWRTRSVKSPHFRMQVLNIHALVVDGVAAQSALRETSIRYLYSHLARAHSHTMRMRCRWTAGRAHKLNKCVIARKRSKLDVRTAPRKVGSRDFHFAPLVRSGCDLGRLVRTTAGTRRRAEGADRRSVCINGIGLRARGDLVAAQKS